MSSQCVYTHCTKWYRNHCSEHGHQKNTKKYWHFFWLRVRCCSTHFVEVERTQHLFDLSVFLVVDFLATLASLALHQNISHYMKFSIFILPLRTCPRSCSISQFSPSLAHSVHRFLCVSQSPKICDKFFGGLLLLQYVAKSFIISRATLQICCARINHWAPMSLYIVWPHARMHSRTQHQ